MMFTCLLSARTLEGVFSTLEMLRLKARNSELEAIFPRFTVSLDFSPNLPAPPKIPNTFLVPCGLAGGVSAQRWWIGRTPTPLWSRNVEESKFEEGEATSDCTKGRGREKSSSCKAETWHIGQHHLLCVPAPWKGCLFWHAGLTHSRFLLQES